MKYRKNKKGYVIRPPTSTEQPQMGRPSAPSNISSSVTPVIVSSFPKDQQGYNIRQQGHQSASPNISRSGTPVMAPPSYLQATGSLPYPPLNPNSQSEVPYISLNPYSPSAPENVPYPSSTSPETNFPPYPPRP